MDNPDNLYDEAIFQLIKASGHSVRIKILKTLEKDAKTAKDLAKLMGASETYVHQHLNRLSGAGLIKKDGKCFCLSTVGKVFINSLDGIEVVGKYKDLWESHSVEKVPVDLLKEMRVFINTELIISAPKVIRNFYKEVSNTQKRFLIATDRVPIIEETSFRGVIEKEVEIFGLIGHVPRFQSLHPNYRIPPNVEVRTTSNENIYRGVLIIDDKEDSVIFPDNEGSLDWNYAIFGKDPDFVSWAEKNFWYMHEKGESLWG